MYALIDVIAMEAWKLIRYKDPKIHWIEHTPEATSVLFIVTSSSFPVLYVDVNDCLRFKVVL